MRHRYVSAIALTAVSLLVSRPALAQREATASSSIMVVRSAGETDGVTRAEAAQPTPGLTLDQLRKLLTSSGVSALNFTGPWKLTPVDPIAGGRAWMQFTRMSYYNPSANVAHLSGTGRVDITVRAVAAERLLLTCAVSGAGTYRLTAPGATSVTSGPNLTALYDAKMAGDAVITIDQHVGPWYLNSCDLYKIQ